jgi:DivIVA domain-containing protein
MPFAPHEIENKRFVVALRGYSTAEVEAFLRAVAADYAAALQAAQAVTPAESEELVRAAERDADRIREAARQEAEACFEEIDRRAAELANREAEVRARLEQLDVAEGLLAPRATSSSRS